MFPEPASHLYVLKRAVRSDGSHMGDIIPLTNLRAPADIMPHFHQRADPRLTKQSSLEYSQEFILNKYFDKNLYFCLGGS